MDGERIQHNLLVTIRKLLGLPREKRRSLCFVCGRDFWEVEENYCPICDTWKCPHCGKCFCDLPEPAKRALDAEMTSLGLWDVGGNPKRRKRRPSPAQRWLYDVWRRDYPSLSYDEFIRRVARGEIKIPPAPPEYFR